jgi:hypothetical protein
LVLRQLLQQVIRLARLQVTHLQLTDPLIQSSKPTLPLVFVARASPHLLISQLPFLHDAYDLSNAGHHILPFFSRKWPVDGFGKEAELVISISHPYLP